MGDIFKANTIRPNVICTYDKNLFLKIDYFINYYKFVEVQRMYKALSQ